MSENPPAFPGQPCGQDGLPSMEHYSGMSLRDYFATCLNCADRTPHFKRGQRVQFDWRYYDDVGSGQGYTATFYGTIMREKPGNKRFSIRVDPDHEDYDLKPADILKSPEFTSVRPADIQSIDEPDRPMCQLCSAYQDDADAKRLCLMTEVICEPAKDCWTDAQPHRKE